MSNVTNNSAMAAATTNFGLLNQLMLSIGGVRADIISSDPYNRDRRVVAILLQADDMREDSSNRERSSLRCARANFVSIATIHSGCSLLLFNKAKNWQTKNAGSYPCTLMTRLFDFFFHLHIASKYRSIVINGAQCDEILLRLKNLCVCVLCLCYDFLYIV